MKTIFKITPRRILTASLAISLAFFGGCSKRSLVEEDGLIVVTLQTDWYAQAEHGGFYQALANGYYEEAGLRVRINQGGPGAMMSQQIASRNLEFAIGRSDDVLLHASRDIPLHIVGAFMQHDPQGILVHEESGIESFEQLDGRAIMATPGAIFIEFLRRRFDIDIQVVPLDYGMSRFVADKNFIQQCFVTNEPYYVRREGANPHTLLLADSGFDPYRVIFANRNYVREHPEVVRAFVEASIRGWNSYMEGNRDGAHAMIMARNPRMTEDFMAFSISVMDDLGLIRGRAENEATGLITRERIAEQIATMRDLGLITRDLVVDDVVSFEFIPSPILAVGGESH